MVWLHWKTNVYHGYLLEFFKSKSRTGMLNITYVKSSLKFQSNAESKVVGNVKNLNGEKSH